MTTPKSEQSTTTQGRAASAGTVALVDDEATLRETVSFALERHGFQVDTYVDGQEAWERFQEELPDVAILDVTMPRMDGLELCRRLRSISERLPILFLTSRDEEFDRVLGLELGADDYLCKPFSMRELEARVKVVFRRLALSREPIPDDETLTLGDVTLDLQRYQTRLGGELVPLTITEFLLVKALVQNPGHVKTRAQLMNAAYEHDTYVSERTIDSHVKRLRKKFTDLDAEFDLIETVYGLGYRVRTET